MVRAVVFLDPYSLQVDWQTLKALAETRVMDVWYLFPLRDVVRQLAKKLSGVGPKEPKLDRVLSPAWRDLYNAPIVSQSALQFDWLESQEDSERQADVRQIESWFRAQLQTIFAYASEPLPLLTSPGRQAFSLFLAVSNPSRPAISLANHFARYVMQRYGSGASRRT